MCHVPSTQPVLRDLLVGGRRNATQKINIHVPVSVLVLMINSKGFSNPRTYMNTTHNLIYYITYSDFLINDTKVTSILFATD